MTIQRHFKLALTAGHTIPLVINANQYDSGEQWLFTLYNDGVRYTPSSGAIVGIKADRLGIINTGTVDANGLVVINETRQMTAAVGKNIFELLIDDQTHGTANFMVLVEPRPGDNADLSESDYSLFEEAIQGTSQAAIKAGVQEWMDENLTDPTDPIVDASLSLSGAAADAKKTGDEISALKSAFNSAFDTDPIVSSNLLNLDEVTHGYYMTNTGATGANATYGYTGLMPVEVGKTYTLQYGAETVKVGRSIDSPWRVIAYDSDKNIVSEAGTTASQQSYTVPSGIAYVRFCTYDIRLQSNVYPSVIEGTTLTDYVAYFEPYVDGKLKRAFYDVDYINELIDDRIDSDITVDDEGRLIFEATASSLSSGTELTVAQRIDNKKNCSYLLFANFSSFDSVSFGHGFEQFQGSYITVDDTNIYQYYYSGGAILQNTYPHGLTISDFLFININVGDVNNFRAKVTIMSASGQFTQENVPFPGCNGDILAKATMAMTNVKCQYVVNDAKYDVFVFGDSYISLGDPNRWAYQMMENGYTHYLLSGFSGVVSLTEIVSFRNIIAVKKPKIVVWALGMNDADTSSAINTNWKTAVDEVISTCATNNIELILATIPNTPTVTHTYKNAYVRNSGKRYVDFAKAVNAESAGATWYTDMLSTDNVHPLVLGAKALANRVLIDVPEIAYQN